MLPSSTKLERLGIVCKKRLQQLHGDSVSVCESAKNCISIPTLCPIACLGYSQLLQILIYLFPMQVLRFTVAKDWISNRAAAIGSCFARIALA